MTLEQSLSYIHGLYRKGTKPGLSRVTALLKALGDPHKRLKFVHIAGTNGKGSTAAMTASILQAAGYRAGHIRRIGQILHFLGFNRSDHNSR